MPALQQGAKLGACLNALCNDVLPPAPSKRRVIPDPTRTNVELALIDISRTEHSLISQPARENSTDRVPLLLLLLTLSTAQ